MRIGFDLRPFLKEETGVGIYFKNLLFHLAQIDNKNEYFLFSSSWKDRFPARKIPALARKDCRDFRIPVRAVNFFWNRLGWPPLDYFFRKELDLTHSPTPLLLPTKGKKIVTVHDLFFMDFPEKASREARRDFFKRTKNSLERADGIVTISRFTKNALRDKFNIPEEKVKVIYLGLDHKFWEDIAPSELEETRRKFDLPSSFILFVGALEPRKNLLNLIEALKIIHNKYKKIQLVIVGPKGEDYKNLEERIGQNRLENWVKILGYLPEKEVRNLYHLASVFAFPSLCEGFGFPLLEAMASGLPIAASSASAIPEVARDAALYFRPEDPENIAEKIVLLLKDENLRRSLQAKGKKRALDFDWKTTASETLSFYQAIFEK